MADVTIGDLDPVSEVGGADLVEIEQDSTSAKASLDQLADYFATLFGVGATDLDDLTDVINTSPTTGDVLRYDLASSAYVNVKGSDLVRTISGTSDTPTTADEGKILRFTNSGAITVLMESAASGTMFTLEWLAGAGTITLDAESDVDLNGLGAGTNIILSAAAGSATLVPTGAGTWDVVGAIGDLSASEVAIADAGGYYTGTDVEAALQEAGASLATKASTSYVDAAVAGLSWKRAVRAASISSVTLANAVENGDALDGVTLATGDRILLKNQSSASENGIYVVAASGAPTRATDADSSAELVNAAVYVSEGTTNADTAWTCTTKAPITVGSTSLAFAQFSGGGGITALTGDVTASGPGSAAATIANDAVTNAKAADMATATIKGRTTAGTGDPEDLTAAQVAALLQGDGLTVDAAGFRGMPQNSQSAAYTIVAADSGKHLLHPSSDANARTFTLPANGSVAFPVGTAITFVNETSQVLSIAITTDTLTLANSTTSGTRSLAQNGVATALKVTSTKWIISGAGLT
jgi:hypothetical protein